MTPRRTFGASWWGAAWIRALEHRAQLDPDRLPRGRTYARQDRVPALVVDRGEVRAAVDGSRPAPYRVAVRIRQFTDDEWDRALDAIAARAGHTAALLEGDLDPAIDEDVRGVGIELLPGAGDVAAWCSCPDWANPCKHAAAVCYLVADRLDEDPFDLLHLRGRTREEVLTALRDRRRSGATAVGGSRSGAPAAARPDAAPETDPVEGDAAEADPGVRASTAWAADVRPAPPPPAARARPGHPPPLASEPGPDAPFEEDGIAALGGDAARRAWALLTGVGDGDLDLGPRHDLARRAAAAKETDRWEGVVAASGERPARLDELAEAWRQAGPSGVDVTDEPAWAAPPLRMAAGRDALADGTGRAVTVRQNRATDANRSTQLRYSTDGRWYRFTKEGGRWHLAAPGADDPTELV